MWFRKPLAQCAGMRWGTDVWRRHEALLLDKPGAIARRLLCALTVEAYRRRAPRLVHIDEAEHEAIGWHVAAAAHATALAAALLLLSPNFDILS